MAKANIKVIQDQLSQTRLQLEHQQKLLKMLQERVDILQPSMPVQPSVNKIEDIANEDKKARQRERSDRFGAFLIDVAKYILTGVVISPLFESLEDITPMYYVAALAFVAVLVWGGIILTGKKK